MVEMCVVFVLWNLENLAYNITSSEFLFTSIADCF